VDISSRFLEPVRGDLLVQFLPRLDYGIHPLRSRSVSECVGTITRSHDEVFDRLRGCVRVRSMDGSTYERIANYVVGSLL
jgi:hypothetical protein